MASTGIQFVDPTTGELVPQVFDDTLILGSTRGVGDFVLEYGYSRSFEPNGISTAGHLLSMNMDDEPLPMDVKGVRGFEHKVMPPRSIFVHPAGAPMTLRNYRAVRFCALEIPPFWVERTLGRDVDLVPHYGLVDESLGQLMSLLERELSRGCPSGPLYTDSLASAFLFRLAALHGNELVLPARGLQPHQLRELVVYIEERLATKVTVTQLAEFVGMSVAHFTREFKRATGEAPHTFVMGRRLERARKLLATGEAIAIVASRCGFVDQAHLGRQFRRRFGMTPGAFQRTVCA